KIATLHFGARRNAALRGPGPSDKCHTRPEVWIKDVLVELPDFYNIDTLDQVRRFPLVITRAAHQHIGLDTTAIRENDAIFLEALDARRFYLQLAGEDAVDEIVVLLKRLMCWRAALDRPLRKEARARTSFVRRCLERALRVV